MMALADGSSPISAPTLVIWGNAAVWSEVAAALTNQTALEALAHEAAAVGQPDIGVDTLGGRIADAARAVADLQQRILTSIKPPEATGSTRPGRGSWFSPPVS
jgi:hypothetical protein